MSNSYKVKYFKDSIIGMKGVLTYSSKFKDYNNKSGIIRYGDKTHRFLLTIDEDNTAIPLSEDDEIYLI